MKSATKSVKVIIVDDSPSFIEGLKVLLSMDDKYEVIGVYSNGKELIESNQYVQADLLLSDIEMPEMNGIEAAKLVNYRSPHLPMIAITMYLGDVYLAELIGAGYRGIIYKPDVADNLFNVIDSVFQEQIIFPKNIKTI